MALDSTMNSVISGAGGGGSFPSAPEDSTFDNAIAGDSLDPNSGPGGQRHPQVQNASLNKPADNGKISPKFYEAVQGNPTSLDSSMENVLELDFSR